MKINTFREDLIYSDGKVNATIIYVVKRTEKTIVVYIEKRDFNSYYVETICNLKRLKCGKIKYQNTESFYYKGVWYNADEFECFQ